MGGGGGEKPWRGEGENLKKSQESNDPNDTVYKRKGEMMQLRSQAGAKTQCGKALHLKILCLIYLASVFLFQCKLGRERNNNL